MRVQGTFRGRVANHPYNVCQHVWEQLDILRLHGFDIRCSSQVGMNDLPQGRIFLVSVRSDFFGSSYERAVQAMFDCLRESREHTFVNHLEGRMGSEQLRQSDAMKNRIRSLEALHEDSDVLIFPAQPGSRSRNMTTLRARGALSAKQFPLSVLDVATCLITHPKLLRSTDHAALICAQDAYFESVGGTVVERVPYFMFEDGQLHFDAFAVDKKDNLFGFPIGFLP